VAALRALVVEGAGVAVVPRSWAAGLAAATLRPELLYRPGVALRPGASPAAATLAAALHDFGTHGMPQT
jgi:DNA-binding transcriptional LysR family regulator